MTFAEAFDATFLISMEHRADRRARALEHLQERGLIRAASEVEIMPAIIGDDMPAPAWWTAGNGAWGCLLSHARVMQAGLTRGLKSWLVLEDDVVFHARAAAHLGHVMADLPRDWGQLYLGGQHLHDPEPATRLLFRAKNVNRTHAFVLNARVAGRVHQHIWHAPDYDQPKGWHIDHQLGRAHERADWPVYAPKWWLAGQEEGTSNISGRTNHRMWWQPGQYAGQVPFFVGEPQTDAQRAGLHYGWNLRRGTWTDVGLNDAIGNEGKLRDWMWCIAREALSLGRLPAMSHECLDPATARRLWGAGVFEMEVFSHELLDYPHNGLFQHDFQAL